MPEPDRAAPHRAAAGASAARGDGGGGEEEAWHRARAASLAATIARASHDVRGALSPAVLAAERLQSSGDPSQQRLGEMLSHSVDRALQLLSEVTAFARESGRESGPERPVERFALRGVLDEVAGGFATLSIAFAGAEALEADADKVALGQAVAHLLRNAAEAGARSIRITATPSPGVARLEIADDGPGLPENVRARLFRPFVTGPGGTGAGLGLATARHLVRAGGGDLSLARTGAGGTAFVITLPARSRPAAGPAAAPG